MEQAVRNPTLLPWLHYIPVRVRGMLRECPIPEAENTVENGKARRLSVPFFQGPTNLYRGNSASRMDVRLSLRGCIIRDRNYQDSVQSKTLAREPRARCEVSGQGE